MPSPPVPFPPAIVTDGLWRKSLSAIRSLGKAGFEVQVMGDSWATTGFWSSFARKRVRAPVAARDPARFGEALLKLLRENEASSRKPVLLPMEDATLNWLSDHREEVASLCDFLIPPRESIRIAQDKGLTWEAARKAGIEAPRAWLPGSPGELREIALGLPTGSFVIKPRTGSGSAGVMYGAVPDESELVARWERLGPHLIQERVASQGRGQGASLLMDQHGECVAAFAHERVRQYPVSGGPSTDRISIDAPALIRESEKLLKSLGWRGVAMVEWKTDPAAGHRPKLLEINPRFWGSLELAVRAGVDFPTLYARAARGEKLDLAPSYASGVRCRWLVPGELLRYLGEPSSARETFREFLRGLPYLAEEWDPRDKRGFLATIACTAALALNPSYWKYLRRG